MKVKIIGLVIICFIENINSLQYDYTKENKCYTISDNKTQLLDYNKCEKSNSYKSSKIEYKNVLNESEIKEKDYISHLVSQLFKYSSVIDASLYPQSSKLCKDHSKLLQEGVRNLDLWALKLHDSSAKYSSGLLNGNINQFGDFDQCLNVLLPSHSLQGKYCLAYLQPEVELSSSRIKTIANLVQSHGAFKSDFNDAGHRVPRFSLINWGICIPSTCTATDLEYSLKIYMENLMKYTGIKFQIRVEPQMCQIKQPILLDIQTKIVIFIFLSTIVITLLSTFYDYKTINKTKNSLLVSFSLLKNGQWLLSTHASKDDIKAVHGIRFLNAIMLLLSHKSMAIFFNPYVNRTFLAESLGQPWTVIGRAASLYTDPFLLFSAMLTSYSLIGKLQQNKQINIKMEYIGRIIRIIPPLIAIILFCTFVLPLCGSGPQWNLVVGHHSNLCKKNWWKNILFIQNYFGFSDMCLTHTHHLGIDTELFFVSPFLILGLWMWPRKFLLFLISVACLGTAGRYYTTIVNELSNYVYFGTTIQKLFKTADFMYSFPPYRSTVYIMGIILGYFLRIYSGHKLSNLQLKLGWTLALICCLLTTFGPAPMGDISYKYNAKHAAIYAAFAPIAWCTIFFWIVFASHLGYQNKLTKILSWKGFHITTKLSYSIYLTQFPVFFYNVGRRRHIDYYYNFWSTMIDVNEYVCIILASVVLTLLFDAPFQNIKKLYFYKNLELDRTNSKKHELSL